MSGSNRKIIENSFFTNEARGKAAVILTCEKDVIDLIENDHWMMDVLKTAKMLDLPDWWVCAGFVRSKIWDTLHKFEERTPLPDVDVIYFDPSNIDEQIEKIYESKLNEWLPHIGWSVKNQGRMHKINNFPPFTSSIDGISKFPETATALGVKLGEGNKVILTAPYGIADVIALHVKPTPFYETEEWIGVYQKRIKKKSWQSIWPRLKIYHTEETRV